MKMFRGATRLAWHHRLTEVGWPEPLAAQLAAWITNSGPLPHWPKGYELVPSEYVRRIVPGDDA
jgi:hypothetical protein